MRWRRAPTAAFLTAMSCCRAGKPVAYKIMTNAAPVMLATPSSLLQARGGFALKNLWVTPHSDAERWPAGDYTIQSKGGEGLPVWTKQVGFVRSWRSAAMSVAPYWVSPGVSVRGQWPDMSPPSEIDEWSGGCRTGEWTAAMTPLCGTPLVRASVAV